MLLDVTVIVIGLALAVAGFAVVILVTVVVLRLLGVVLGEGGTAADPGDDVTDVDAGDEPGASEDAAGAGSRDVRAASAETPDHRESDSRTDG